MLRLIQIHFEKSCQTMQLVSPFSESHNGKQMYQYGDLKTHIRIKGKD